MSPILPVCVTQRHPARDGSCVLSAILLLSQDHHPPLPLDILKIKHPMLMYQKSIVALFLLAILSASVPCHAQEPADSLDRTAETLQRIQSLSYFFEAADKEIQYSLFVPSTYRKDQPTPLVVALHGLNGTPHQIIRYPQFTTLAEKHGYIVVAPMGFNTRGWYGSLGNRGGRAGDPDNLGELSEQDVMNVVEIIEKNYNVDPNRICLMGHSMGGGGTLHIGIKYPEKWAALGPISPAIYRSPDELEKIPRTPVILVQGDKDRLVPVSIARNWVNKMKDLQMNHRYIEVPNGGHLLVAFQHLPDIFEFFNAFGDRRQRNAAVPADAAPQP